MAERWTGANFEFGTPDPEGQHGTALTTRAKGKGVGNRIWFFDARYLFTSSPRRVIYRERPGEPRAVRPGVELRLPLQDKHRVTSIGNQSRYPTPGLTPPGSPRKVLMFLFHDTLQPAIKDARQEFLKLRSI